MKKTNLLKGLLVVVLMVASVFALVGCDVNSIIDNNKDNDEVDKTYTYVTMRINPEVGLLVDSETGEVVDTIALNDDADTLLADVELNGETVEEATETIVSEAVEAGFLDPEDDTKTVYIDVTNTDEDNNDETIEDLNNQLFEKIKNNINKFFVENGILANAMLEDLSEYAEKAIELGVSEKKAKLIEITLELNPEMNEADLAKMSEKELLVLCHKAANGKVNHALNEMFKESVKTIIEDNDELAEILAQIEEVKNQLAPLYDEINTYYATLLNLNNDLLTATEEEALVIKAKIEEVQAAINELQAQIDVLEAELADLQDQYNKLYNTVKHEIREEINKAKDEIEKTAKEHKEEALAKKAEKEEKIKEKLAEYKEYVKEHKDEVKEKIEKAQKDHEKEIEEVIEGFSSALTRIQEIKEKLEGLYKELNELNEKLEQLNNDLLNATTEEEAKEITLKIEAVKADIEIKQAEINTLEAELRSLVNPFSRKNNN